MADLAACLYRSRISGWGGRNSSRMMPFIDLRGQTANLGHSWGPFGGLVTLGVVTGSRSVSGPQRGPLGGAKGGAGQVTGKKLVRWPPSSHPLWMAGRGMCGRYPLKLPLSSADCQRLPATVYKCRHPSSGRRLPSYSGKASTHRIECLTAHQPSISWLRPKSR